MSEPSNSNELEVLLTEVDARFDAVLGRNRSRMECGEGCSDCCRCRLSVTRVEEAFIRRGLARRPLAVRRELKARTTEQGREMCPALDANGSCQIYEIRPLACRAFGAPQRYRYPVPLIHPSKIDVCDKNFKEVALDALASEDVLDQTELNEKLESIEPNTRDERVPLAKILFECV